MVTIDCVETEIGVRCALQGELDLAAHDEALNQLLSVIDRKYPAVVLDLAEIEFIDSTGLRVLLACQNRAADNGTRLLLSSIGPAVRRLFDVTKLGDRFEFLEDG